MIRSKLVFKSAWFYFFIIKILYMLLALFVYSNFTSLGDTPDYLSGRHFNVSLMFIQSTNMIGTIGTFFSTILGTTLANIPFLILSFYGIYYPIQKINLTNKQLYYLLGLLSLPTFGIWTSICSKESVSVFFMGIIVGYIIDILKYKKVKIRLIHFVALYLLLLFKPQYMIAIISIVLIIKIYQYNFLTAYVKSFIFFMYIAVSSIALYISRDIIDRLSFILPQHFYASEGNATRDNIFIVEQYDIFLNAPYNMFLAFWGPTWSEVIQRPIHGLAFIESFFIVSLFIYFIYVFIKKIYITLKINITNLSIIIISVFWLLFVHIPFGLFNYGSALRYRENFYSFLVILLYYVFIRMTKRNTVQITNGEHYVK
jgi:hypothetical protein